ncbi:HAMP domain-containing protein [Paenibacillus lignilyticus]|uniref:histidine kinase n=1 Tax=Paenibacillus lignilyticus TaxID=1172615 RepID=A0ABS5CGU8_9BACL|nr:HAMP domain-containing protein [Paenibacillus lignilyticus]MBP3965051.1 HAMP domain-containing protein [Paenibacillus lignilyticus]
MESDTLTASESIPKAELSASAVTEAKKKFDTANMIILAIVSVLGMGLVYLFAGRSLRPIHNLSHMISAITDDDLRKRIPYENRNDEVGQLGQSFNIMLDRLEKSFSQQKRFFANAAHELKTPFI